MLIGKSMYSTVLAIRHPQPALWCNRIYRALPLAQICGQTLSNWLINVMTDQNIRYRSWQQVGQNDPFIREERFTLESGLFSKEVSATHSLSSDEIWIMCVCTCTYLGANSREFATPLVLLLLLSHYWPSADVWPAILRRKPGQG